MRIFVAGATGAIGRELVPKLIADGRLVTGSTRFGGKWLLGWWWADPIAAIVNAVLVLGEAMEAWRGEEEETAPVVD